MPTKTIEADIIRIRHIQDACREVKSFIKDKTLENVRRERMLALSLVKEIEIIGEAASKVSDIFRKKYPEIPWDIIVGTRHRLVHGYFDIDLEIIWQTVSQDLPQLASQITKILKEEKK